MAKFTPRSVLSSFGSISALNANFQDIAALLEKVLFRDSRTDNALNTPLDVNHFRLRNVGAPIALTDAARLADIVDVMAPTGSELALLGSAAGAALIGGVSPNGYTTTVASQLTRNYIDDLPGFVEGDAGNAVTNAGILNAALEEGGTYYGKPDSVYRVAGLLLPTNGGTLVYEGPRGNRPRFYFPAANFPRASNLEAGRYNADGVGIRIFGGQNDASIDGLTGTVPVEGVTLTGFILQFEVADNRNVIGVYVRNARDVTLSQLEVLGLPLGVGIQLDDVTGDSRVSDIYLHDFYTNTSNANLVINAPNVTGLGMGGNSVTNAGVVGVNFNNIRVENMSTGPAFQEGNSKADGNAAEWTQQRADQSDAINLSATNVRNCKFSNIEIDGCGEGLDIFGTDNQFTNVNVRNARIFGVKFIHGASRNQLNNVTIENPGLGGVTFNGTDAVACVDNRIENLTIRGVNSAGIWSAGNGGGTSTAAADTYGVTFVKGAFKAQGNRISNVLIDGGPNCRYGYIDTAEGDPGNYGLDVEIRNTTLERVYIAGTTSGRVRILGSTAFVKEVNSVGGVIV